MCLASKLATARINFILCLCLTAGLPLFYANAQVLPTVDGKYYGSGDDARYILLGVDETESAHLLYAIDESTTTLYLAGVYVDGPDGDGLMEASDNVFAPEPRNPYVQAAGWNHRRFDHVMGSDHARFRIRCGGSDGIVYDFSIDLLENENADPCDSRAGVWTSTVNGSDGAGNPPPGLITASSMSWNMNNTLWDCDLDQTPCPNFKDWHAPDTDWDLSPLDEGYPYFNEEIQWEWSTVYEMSMDYSWCGGARFEVSIWDLHSSPWKPDWTPPGTPLIAYSDIGALPLIWEFVKAKPEGKAIMIEWATYQEQNVSHFEIQRSADGVNYENIASVPFEDSRTLSNEWEYTDKHPFSGVNYYRIKQLDHDGKFEYSPIATAQLENSDARSAIFPNPASDIITLKGLEAGKIRITDQMGKAIAELEVYEEYFNGQGEYQLDVSGLQSGIYFISWDETIHRMIKE